jgi:Alginate lyase
MRRPSIVVLLAVVVCTLATWTAASVLAQTRTHHKSTTSSPATTDQQNKGYMPGSATRSASGASTATRPSQVLDLHNWYLTLPTGSSGEPDTVRQPALTSYSSPFFQLDPTRDGVVLTSNAGGVTTANSSYPRSELREMDGDKLASWSNASGTHTMEVRQAVTQLPKAKPEVVTAQIHDTKSDVMEVRLEGKRLIGQYADGKQDFVIDPAYVLGTPYDLRVVATSGRIDVWYNGNHAGGLNQSGSGWYFKTGSYLQSNTDRGDAANAMAKVVLYSVGVSHSG